MKNKGWKIFWVVLLGIIGSVASIGFISLLSFSIKDATRHSVDRTDPTYLVLLLFLVVAALSFFGIYRIFVPKPKRQIGSIESTGEDDYVLYEDDEKLVFCFVLHKPNSLIRKVVKGRFIEITDTTLTISAPYPLHGRKQKQQSLSRYQQGTWRNSAKSYDRSKITGVRMYADQFEKDPKKLSEGYQDHTAFVVAFDYGNKTIDINYHWERDLVFPKPWSQFHEQQGLTLHKAFTHALNVQRPHNAARQVSDNMSVSGGYAEADDMVNKIMARQEAEKKSKDDDMPDPF